MAATRRPAALPALLVLIGCSLTCHASPIQSVGDGVAADPLTAKATAAPSVIDVQEQIYIITGVFITFIIFLLAVSLATAYVVIGMRQTIQALQSGGAALARKPTMKASQNQQPAAKRTQPAPAQQQPLQRDNRAFAPDDDDDDDNYRRGDDVQGRGYDQYPEHPRSEPPRADRQLSSPSHVSEPQPYDRFHQPLPDAQMPADSARRDSHSRYGAGNLSRLPKGPAPQPGGYDGRYPDERERRTRSPGRGQW